MKKKIQHKKEPKDFTTKLLKMLAKNPTKSYTYKQLAARLDVKDSLGKNLIIRDLRILVAQGKINQVEKGKYIVVQGDTEYYEGVIDMTTRKTAYFICDDLNEDVFIPTTNLNRALDKDRVQVYIYQKRGSNKMEGEVVEVLERNTVFFVGVIAIKKSFAFVVVNNAKMYTDIFIPIEHIGEAKDGDMVQVELLDWPKRKDSPYGKVIKVLGKPGEHNTEIHAILAEYGLPSEFPLEVQEYAENIDTSIKESEVQLRKDIRDVLTFTIDPKDAKDFDDALSFRYLENGNIEVGVHIADVSYYLKEGSVLDKEAFERGTSVYLVDRVVPMLPEVLSNVACSLRPNEDKYTFSAIFELNTKAEIINKWFGRTVIHSDQRFAYEEAQSIIETKSEIIPASISLTGVEYVVDKNICQATLELDRLAKILRKKRMNEGAISFDKVEVKFKLDENANPTGVYFKEAKDANHLIEEFMLLANRKVAEFIGKQTKTFVYRIHDEPDTDKLLTLQGVISKFGYSLNLKSKKNISSSLNTLLANVHGKKEQNLIDTLSIRAMSKAAYSTDNIGHYGLAFDYYTHFTSPIRRYPDVMVHRLLQYYLDDGNSVSAEDYEEKCKHSSDMEMLATKAERDSIKYMQVRYMQDHDDQEFLGVISGVTEWGIFVEIIENKCEGLVRIREIGDDYYTFDEKQYAMVGSRGSILQLGDEVIVTVKNADLVKKQLDFNYIKRIN